MSRTAQIFLRSITVGQRDKIVRKLSWRDTFINENGEREELLYEGNGGEIRFYWDSKAHRSIPYMFDVYANSRINSYPQIKKYVEAFDFPHKIVYETPNREIVVEIKEGSGEDETEDFDSVLHDLESDLSRSNILTYEVSIR